MKIILTPLIATVVFFAANDGLRDTFLENSPVSYVKEFAVILLFLLLSLFISFSRHNILNKKIVFFNLLFLFLITTSFVTTKLTNMEYFLRADSLSFGGWSVWIKVVIFGLLTNSLVLLFDLKRNLYYKIPLLYVKCVVFYSVLTLFFVGTGFNKMLPMRNWHGRLSIGYPTMDAFILIIACVFTVFYVRKHIYVAMLHFLFLLVLIMQNTVSGYLLLLSYLLFMIFILPGKWKLIPVSLLFASSISVAIVYVYISTKLGAFGSLIIDKVNGFIFGSETASVSLRQEQINYLMESLTLEKLRLAFGIGGVGAFAVENQFYSILGMFGIFGTIICLLATLFMLLAFYRRKDRLSMLLTLLYFIGSLSLAGIYLYPMIFVLSFVIARFSIYEKLDYDTAQVRWNLTKFSSCHNPKVAQPLSRAERLLC